MPHASTPSNNDPFRASRTLEQQLELYHIKRISIDESTLAVLEGPHKGLEVPLARDVIYIGRADWCDLALPQDKHISSVHCEIRVEDEGFRLLDRGSRNGCFLDDHRVFDALIQPDVPIALGNTVFSLRRLSGKADIDVRYADESGMLVGQHPKMREIFAWLSRLGAREIPVLLTGETGTGKTSIAEALHAQSQRRGDFVVVNCGALTPSLVESELFGYEKGAFTGANKTHRGFFEQADGGTLFLDEIGELPLELQSTLLSALERKKIRRIGGTRDLDVDFRLVTATHRHLKEDIEEGRFRQDLYYRLAVMELHVPSLRDRRDDIPLLATHLMQQIETERYVRMTSGAYRILQDHYWPGNLRELRNVLERSLLLVEGTTIDEEALLMPSEYQPSHRAQAASELRAQDAPPAGSSGRDEGPQREAATLAAGAAEEELSIEPMKAQLAAAEREILKAALERVRWNVSRCAQLLEVSRSWLHGRIRSYELQRPSE